MWPLKVFLFKYGCHREVDNCPGRGIIEFLETKHCVQDMWSGCSVESTQNSSDIVPKFPNTSTWGQLPISCSTIWCGNLPGPFKVGGIHVTPHLWLQRRNLHWCTPLWWPLSFTISTCRPSHTTTLHGWWCNWLQLVHNRFVVLLTPFLVAPHCTLLRKLLEGCHFGRVRLHRKQPQICGWCGLVCKQLNRTIRNRPQISTANSGGSLLIVQSVSGGWKLHLKFAVQSNTL